MKNTTATVNAAEGTPKGAGLATLSSKKKGTHMPLYDSDDHDDFNPINDLMPPSIASDDIEKIGKKRGRDKDPLRRLVEEFSADETSAAGAPHQSKRGRVDPTVSQTFATSTATQNYKEQVSDDKGAKDLEQEVARKATSPSNAETMQDPEIPTQDNKAKGEPGFVNLPGPAAYNEDGSSEFSPTNARKGANFSSEAPNFGNREQSAAAA